VSLVGELEPDDTFAGTPVAVVCTAVDVGEHDRGHIHVRIGRRRWLDSSGMPLSLYSTAQPGPTSKRAFAVADEVPQRVGVGG
jgi:hypothetical protein